MEQQILKFRQFNRFYTRFLGLLNDRLLDSPLNLTEARVTLEIGQNPGCTAAQLTRFLRLDRGYVSRILRRLEREGYLVKERSRADGRSMSLTLTETGRGLLADLNQRSSDDAASILDQLPRAERARLLAAMDSIINLLSPLDRP